MKKYLVLIAIILSGICAQTGFATQLPAELKNYIITNSPDATIRFDGLITLPDGTLYLPLIPAYGVSSSEFGVKKTYPTDKNFSQKPDVIIFSNNYCLLKLIKKDKGYTVATLKEMPLEMRSGILPQDLLVPKGLVLPDVLVGILGDLDIPLNSNLKIDNAKKKNNALTSSELNAVPQKINVIPQLSNKQFFITNFNSNLIYIMPADMRDVQYTLKLDSVPRAVKEINNKFLMVATNGKTYVDVVDVQNEEIAKQIDIGVEADEILISKDQQTAYIISNKSPNIFVIDLVNMALTKQIQVKGLPEKLNFSDDETKLIYQDSATNDIYTVEINNNYVNIYQCNVANVSKLAVAGNKVYALSRTQNKLRIFPYQAFVVEQIASNDFVIGAPKTYYIKNSIFAAGSATKNFFKRQKEDAIKEAIVENGDSAEVSNKPVDMIYYNGKIYILSASKCSVDVFNPETGMIEKTIPLSVAGFTNKFNRLQEQNLVIITNVVEKQYVVFDLEKQAVLQVNPIDIPITTLTVVNKTKVSKKEETKVKGKELENITPDERDLKMPVPEEQQEDEDSEIL